MDEQEMKELLELIEMEVGLVQNLQKVHGNEQEAN